jgi:hypothetical protein
MTLISKKGQNQYTLLGIVYWASCPWVELLMGRVFFPSILYSRAYVHLSRLLYH